ncbi:MAG: sterol desaturase family protein [Phenylobacterium sp.]|uniref:sterol desaturase family protein n=1 Tax=Phenylobacterium sp. TaxID=1871053 RepID=UPI002733EE34|nr:sterol desaturase family protein [Phenylobacterium sp.]MDP3745633.1 sterol desaturase family protein [Phenylobacterium sp.]
MTLSGAWLLAELKVFGLAVMANWLRYVFVAGTLYLLLYKTPIGRRGSYRDPSAEIPRGQIYREIALSSVSCLIFSVSAVAIHAVNPLGVTHIYDDAHRYGLLILPVTLLAIVVLFDAYFYFTHRMLHVIGVKRSTHYRHHISVYPTPWAALAFSVPEAAIIALFFFLVATAFPIYISVYRAFIWIVFIQSALHHSSHKIYPDGWKTTPILGWWTTADHHHLHHRFGACNFGLYFTLWDRVLGTEHPDYLNDPARRGAVAPYDPGVKAKADAGA